MRKEILLAIVVGVLVGLSLTFVLYLVRQRLSDTSTIQTIEQSRQGTGNQGSDDGGNTRSLTIQQPEVDTYSTEAEVRVVGRTIPNSYIVTLVGTQEFITTADVDGDFSQTITLTAGGNRLTIVSTSPDGVQETEVRSVVYSAVDLDAPTSTASATPSATPRATATPAPGGN